MAHNPPASVHLIQLYEEIDKLELEVIQVEKIVKNPNISFTQQAFTQAEIEINEAREAVTKKHKEIYLLFKST